MPFKTQYGKHYHETLGCHGATIPCSTEGLEPCSDCCGGGKKAGDGAGGSAVGGGVAPAGGGSGSYGAEVAAIMQDVDATVHGDDGTGAIHSAKTTELPIEQWEKSLRAEAEDGTDDEQEVRYKDPGSALADEIVRLTAENLAQATEEQYRRKLAREKIDEIDRSFSTGYVEVMDKTVKDNLTDRDRELLPECKQILTDLRDDAIRRIEQADEAATDAVAAGDFDPIEVRGAALVRYSAHNQIIDEYLEAEKGVQHTLLLLEQASPSAPPPLAPEDYTRGAKEVMAIAGALNRHATMKPQPMGTFAKIGARLSNVLGGIRLNIAARAQARREAQLIRSIQRGERCSAEEAESFLSVTEGRQRAGAEKAVADDLSKMWESLSERGILPQAKDRIIDAAVCDSLIAISDQVCAKWGVTDPSRLPVSSYLSLVAETKKAFQAAGYGDKISESTMAMMAERRGGDPNFVDSVVAAMAQTEISNRFCITEDYDIVKKARARRGKSAKGLVKGWLTDKKVAAARRVTEEIRSRTTPHLAGWA